MRTRIVAALSSVFAVAVLAYPSPSVAIPAFARKYETSCLTCHSVYPRLTPFGEAFRRNGYRFPGVDSDYVKQGQIVLGQEANKKTFPNSVWPGGIPASVPLAFGVNGQGFWFPKSTASVPRANNGTAFVLDNLVAEGHLWAGAALDDTITLWAEMTFADGGAEVEHAQILFNDLLGPQHALNLVVGRGVPTLTSFGLHSTYLGDVRFTTVPLTGIYGLSSDPFTLVDNYNGAEVTGVLGAGRVDYSAGLSNGKNVTGVLSNSENVYAHVGFKLGGMRLDGEGDKGPKDAMRPWAEDALTVDGFWYHSRENFAIPGTDPAVNTGDTSTTFGGAARAQLGSLELDLGAYSQKHDRGWTDPTGALASVKADVEWAELSYVLFPWMVPAIRVERIGLKPSGGDSVSNVHVMPGIAFLIRPNLKAVLVANIEFAKGFPVDAAGAPLTWDGGNADWGNFHAAGDSSPSPTSKLNEFESFALFLAWAM
jgi:hypothetical protein